MNASPGESTAGLLVVDVGKSSVRGRLRTRNAVHEATITGVPPDSAGRPDGGRTLAAVLGTLWDELVSLEAYSPGCVRIVIVGSTAVPGPHEIDELLTAIGHRWPRAHLVFAEDGVLAHAAALKGPGIVASIGTGTIVSGLSSEGSWHRLDGWGPDLGDRGSAAWLGTAGLRAAFASLDGVGPATTLLAKAREHLGATDLRTATQLLAAPDRVRILAAFAEQVCAATPEDSQAANLVEEAAHAASATIVRMATVAAEKTVTVLGRLGSNDLYRQALQRKCADHQLHWVEAHGTMLDVDPHTLRAWPYIAACHSRGPRI